MFRAAGGGSGLVFNAIWGMSGSKRGWTPRKQSWKGGARLGVEANLKLQLPFFANELLGAIHLHGPLGLAPWLLPHGFLTALEDTIMDFCGHLRSVLQAVALTASKRLLKRARRRPAAFASAVLGAPARSRIRCCSSAPS